MTFHNLIKINNKETFLILLLFFLSIFLRIPIILIFGDTTIEHEWNPLLYNLINHKILAVKEFNGFLLPNLLMPPLYAYYLYFFSFINFEVHNFILLVLFSQMLLASISVVIFFKINRFFFSDKISFYSSLLFSLFPIYLYSCSQISSISLTIFLAIFFYYYFFQIKKNKKYIYIFIFSFISGLLILVRREFAAIIILSSLYLFLFCRIPFRKILLIFIITSVTISPYLTRNYLIFDKIILQAGTGYNLWKANNPKSTVQGYEVFESDKNLNNLVSKIPRDKFYRINEDKIFIKESIKNIKNDPKKYLILYTKRVISYFFIDLKSTHKNYYNPFHYVPILILGITSLAGILISDKKSSSLNYLILIIAFYLIVFSIFAIQPRYKIYIIPLQIIFSNIFFIFVVSKYRLLWPK